MDFAVLDEVAAPRVTGGALQSRRVHSPCRKDSFLCGLRTAVEANDLRWTRWEGVWEAGEGGGSEKHRLACPYREPALSVF